MSRHFSSRARQNKRYLAIAVCLALLLSTLVLGAPRQSAAQNPRDQARGAQPVSGPPALDLPNLDAVRGQAQAEPPVRIPIPSSLRARRKPLVPRNGLKVGDPGTTLGAIGRASAGKRVRTGSRRGRVRTQSNHSRGKAIVRLARTRRSLPRAVPPPLADDWFAQNFFCYALARPGCPSNTLTANEQTYWYNILRTAYQHGQTSLVMAVRELGKTVFESAEYAARNTSNHDYVQDLYETYLVREPDSGGWAFWEGLIPQFGRENVRRAFDESAEFIGVVATLTPNGSITGTVSSLVSARVEPKNQSGNQILARDAGWSAMLMSLRGRAGLDLGLGVSFSSAATWTAAGPYAYFDEDNSSLSPGFRIGFPTVQELFFDAQIGQNVYLLITSAASRVALRQVGATNHYVAGDSSYLDLIDNGGGSLLLRTTDGTQMSYTKIENEYRCVKIEDRNGNTTTANYNSLGDLTTVVDTLNRTITFSYDVNANLSSITQSWNGTSHTWAQFGWSTTTIHPVFSGLALSGVKDNQSIPVVQYIYLADNSYYKFTYDSGTTTKGLVTTFERWAVDGLHKGSVIYDYTTAAGDIPRITAAHDYADYWNGFNGVPSDISTQFSAASDNSWCRIATPDGAVSKVFYPTSGWQKGLGLASSTQVFANASDETNNLPQKTTVTTWTQDNTSVNYLTNPRVTEINITDAANNHRRLTYSYTAPIALPEGGTAVLPSDVYEWDALGSTVLRRTHTDYNTGSTYVSSTRRLLGLAAATLLCNGAEGNVPCSSNSGASLLAKTTLQYDEVGSAQYQGAPTQHDEQNFGSGMLQGRGNLSSVRRYNVSNLGQYVTTSMVYNTTGSVISTTDPMGHTSTISYTDAFSDNTNHNTLAYPTTVTNADGFSAYVQYHFDFGGVTWQQTPAPNAGQTAPKQTITYDSLGRVSQITNNINAAYRRYVYGATYVQTYATVNNPVDEAYSISFLDGNGRVYYSASNHPGSVGGYRGVTTVYDVMGRVWKSSNPTEVNSSSFPAGDDAAGWLYTTQTYDWQGRPLVTTNTDLTTKTASYNGCGCAGGEVMTLKDEGTLDNGVAKRRQQKIYSDVLGRTLKTEIYNWEGGSVYATTVNTYNALDQVTQVRQYQGTDASPTFQDTTMSYDGYGRLLAKHVPEQNAGTNTVYAYNPDDTIQRVTDARGSYATYSYNNRHLVTNIVYTPSAGVTATAPVTFVYDAAGNRTSMTDGLGSKTYSYNQLSQMTSETRTFSDSNNPSINGVVKTLSYDSNLAGELKKITDSTNMTINYSFDTAGRLNGVTGSGSLYAGVSNYASNFQYRAWGGLKAMTGGTNHVSSLTYNSKLQPSSFDISGSVVHQNYDYYNDGRISFVHNTTDLNFDRSYFYDHAARLTEAKTGGMARGDFGDTPYYETFSYDAFSNLIGRESTSWTLDPLFDSATYTNDRRVGWGYDADGRNTTIGTRTYSFDADGQMTLMTGQKWVVNHYVSVSQAMGYDGDGLKVKDTTSGITTYYLRSSLMDGAIIEEIDSGGQKTVGYVYAEEQLLARQSYSQVTWKYITAAGSSQYDLPAAGGVGRTEFDPVGADIGLYAPPAPDTGGGEGDIGGNHIGGIMDARWSNFFDQSGGCTANVTASCSGVPSPDAYMQAQMKQFFGDSWYDLPGNNNEREQAEGIYVAMVQRTIAAYNAQKKKSQKKKPKSPPRLRKRGDTRPRRVGGVTRPRRAIGPDNEGPAQELPQNPVRSNPSYQFQTPLSNPNAPYTSRSGMLRPCKAEVKAVMTQIARAFGGTVDENNQINMGSDVIAYGEMEMRMKELGFVEFTNENAIDHTPTYAFGFGAYHWEGNVLGNWYHLIFPRESWLSGYVTLAKDAHYEVDRSDSLTHRNAIGEHVPCEEGP